MAQIVDTETETMTNKVNTTINAIGKSVEIITATIENTIDNTTNTTANSVDNRTNTLAYSVDNRTTTLANAVDNPTDSVSITNIAMQNSSHVPFTSKEDPFDMPIPESKPVQETHDDIVQTATASIFPSEETAVMSLQIENEKEKKTDSEPTVLLQKLSRTQPLPPRTLTENQQVIEPKTRKENDSNSESESHLLIPDEQDNIDISSSNDQGLRKFKNEKTDSSFTRCKCKLFKIAAVVFGVILFIGLIAIGHWRVCTNTNKSMNSTDRIINPKKGFLDVNANINISKSSMQVTSLHLEWSEIIESNRQIVNLTWKEINTPVVNIKENGSKIQVNQNGSYLFLLSLNVDTGNEIIAKETNAKRSLILVCIHNSRGQQEKCQKQKLAPNTSGPLSIQSMLILYQGDAVWVSVAGARYLYINNAMNSFTIIKWNN